MYIVFISFLKITNKVDVKGRYYALSASAIFVEEKY